MVERKTSGLFTLGILSMVVTHALVHAAGNLRSTLYPILMEEFQLTNLQMQLGKPLKAYDTNPQHVKAARMLVEMGYEIDQGDIIRYVVTKNDVKPSIIAEPKDVDIKKYEEYLESTFEQLLDALDMSFDQLVGRPQQKSLSAFFG